MCVCVVVGGGWGLGAGVSACCPTAFQLPHQPGCSAHPTPTAGAVVGGVVAAALVAGGVWYGLKRRREKRATMPTFDEPAGIKDGGYGEQGGQAPGRW